MCMDMEYLSLITYLLVNSYTLRVGSSLVSNMQCLLAIHSQFVFTEKSVIIILQPMAFGRLSTTLPLLCMNLCMDSLVRMEQQLLELVCICHTVPFRFYSRETYVYSVHFASRSRVVFHVFRHDLWKFIQVNYIVI